MFASTHHIYYCYYYYYYYYYHNVFLKDLQKQIALAPLPECTPQCGIEEEDGSAEEEAEAAAEEEYE